MDQWMVISLIIIVILLLIINYSNRSAKNETDDRIKTIIEILIRQTARWAVAAEQDNNPLIAVLHGNYAAGYLWALKDISSSEEIKAATGIDLKILEREVTRIQDLVTKRMIELCPDYAGEGNKILAAIAGEG